jgi:hypothetical protein
MRQLDDAHPDADRDRDLRTDVNTRFLSSFSGLLDDISASGLETEPYRKKVDSIEASRKISGMCHVIYDRLLSAARQQDIAEIERILKCFLEVPDNLDKTRIIGWYLDGYSIPLHELYFDACDESFVNTYGVHFDGENNSPEEYAGARASLDQSIRRMKLIDPELYGEFNTLITDVMAIHSPTMNAATSICALGIIRVSQLRPGQNWTRYLENLVHEAAHHHLNYVWFSDPIILNEDSGTYSSPLRREKRPLSGIYHAMFVLARTMHMIRALQNHSSFNPETDSIASAYNNAGNSHSFEKKFEDCWTVLKDHARLTKLGENLMASSRELAFEG